MFLAVDIGNTQTTLGLFDAAAPDETAQGKTPGATAVHTVRQWRMAP